MAAEPPPTPAGVASKQALAYMVEMSPGMRGGAILDRDGEVLAASGDEAAWGEAAAELFGAADAAGDEPVELVHLGTEGGEVFGLRDGRFAAVAVTDRFVLGSLMAFDMRTALRDVASAGNGSADA